MQMPRDVKTDGQVVRKRLVKPTSPIGVFTQSIHLPALKAAQAQRMVVLTGNDDGALPPRRPVAFNGKWDVGLEGKDTAFFLPGGLLVLSRMIAEARAKLKGLGAANAEAANQKFDLLRQVETRAFELSRKHMKKMLVVTERVPGCAADLLKIRNEVTILSAAEARGRVCLGNRVKLKFLDNFEELNILIGSFHSNGYGKPGERSYATPLAQVLMGESVGSECELETGCGINTRLREFRILQIV